jgi:hypothetical protein
VSVGMLTSVTRSLFVLAVASLAVGVSANRPGPAYLSVAASAVTIVLLVLWPKLARAQSSERSTSSHTISPSGNSP